jgi:hypothetical protein
MAQQLVIGGLNEPSVRPSTPSTNVSFFFRGLGAYLFIARLPLDAVFAALEALQAQPDRGPLTAWLPAESGYAPVVNPPEWIEKLHPRVVLLCVAAVDREGRPAPETLEIEAGYMLLRTDRNGWIELSTDGNQMWVEAEKR